MKNIVFITFLAFLCLCSCKQSSGDATAISTEIQIYGAPQMAMHQPRGICALPDGSCIVIDRSGKIIHFNQDTSVRRNWWLPTWKAGQPVDLCHSPWDTILVADTHYHRVLEYSLEGKLLRKFGESVGMGQVRSVAVGQGDVIYVSDYGFDDRIHRFQKDGSYLGCFGQRGEGEKDLLRPEGLAVGADGTVYVVDCGHHRLQCFTAEGEYLRTIPANTDSPGQLQFPFDVAIGSNGRLYIVEFGAHRISSFSAKGEFLGTIGAAGKKAGYFATPRGIAVVTDSKGDSLYVADTDNQRVQSFQWERN